MNKSHKIMLILIILLGVIMICGGVGGIIFTYKSVIRENITTPPDASIPNTLVAGPLTLKSQADIIRTHTLHMTNEQTYAQMPRQVAKLDARGSPVLDQSGKPVMVDNSARDIWITATSLITALNLGIITYAFFTLVILVGLVFVLLGAILL